jgi:hypothetical protein
LYSGRAAKAPQNGKSYPTRIQNAPLLRQKLAGREDDARQMPNSIGANVILPTTFSAAMKGTRENFACAG